jgi:hypothetical protein
MLGVLERHSKLLLLDEIPRLKFVDEHTHALWTGQELAPEPTYDLMSLA